MLTAVKDAVRGLLRARGLLFLWGVDEFAVLLSHTTRHEAEAIAEQLRARVLTHVVAATSAGI